MIKHLGNDQQVVNYAYNERGWLKNSSSSMFSLNLNYNTPQYGSAAQWNGNIAEQVYNAAISGSQYVTYSYDNLNRLTNGNSSTGFSETGISYDPLGNLQGLTRSNYGSLSYNYTGNQLTSVGGYTARSYTYDPNGNATSDGQGHGFTYNYLNLPSNVSGLNLAYTYDETGNKLKKISGSTITDYISGVQYTNGAIDFVQTEEGRAINNGGTYKYEYTLTDHLGNNRVTFDQTNGKVGEDDYYPFGFNVHRQQNAGNRYLYNRKELQEELTQYDYGARFYDPVIGRWTTPDPLAEKLPGWSPYNYVLNNPMKLFDPDGMFPFPVTVRAFAPPGSFKGSGFDDDKRGFSASSNASSRLSQTTTIDSVTGQVSGGHVTSTGTHFFGIPVGNAENFSSEGSVDRIGMSVSGDNHTLSVDQHLTGSDPAGLKLAPDVMLNSGISLTENDKAGYLDANITLTGKGFPASEALIGDTGGKNILLTGAATYGGLTDLIKNDPKQVASIGVRISIDGKGNFTGVTYNGKNYSVADWNKAQQAAPAGPHHNYSKQNIQGQTEQ